MIKVESNKLNKIISCLRGIICAAVVVAMVILFRDMYEYFSGALAKMAASVIYLALMIIMIMCVYTAFDEAVMYMIVERKEFRVKHLFRKEVIYTWDQLTKWKCYTQYIRNGTISENIVIYFDNKTKVEFGINANTNFERLLNHLQVHFKEKEQ